MASDPADIAGGGGTRREGATTDSSLIAGGGGTVKTGASTDAGTIAGGQIREDPAITAGRADYSGAPVRSGAYVLMHSERGAYTSYVGGGFDMFRAPAVSATPAPQPVQNFAEFKAQATTNATLNDQKYISTATSLPLKTVQNNWVEGVNYSSKIGAYSYSALTASGIAQAETTGKGWSPITGDIYISKQPTFAVSAEKESVAASPFSLFSQNEQGWRGVPYKAVEPEMRSIKISQPVLEMRGGKPFEGYIDFSSDSVMGKSPLVLATAMGMPQENFATRTGIVLSESRTTPNQVFLQPSGKFAEAIVSKEIGISGKRGEGGTFILSGSASALSDKEGRFEAVVRQASINKAYADQQDKMLLPSVQATKEGLNIYSDIDKRWQGVISSGKSVFFGDKPNATEAWKPLSPVFPVPKIMAWGFGTTVLEGSAVEGTKLGLGFVQASQGFGTALRYGEPSISPYIKLTQDLTGTRPALTAEQTKLYLKSGFEGAGAYYSFPVQLAVAGKVGGFISREAPILSSKISNLPVISKVSSKIPFSIVPTLSSQPVLFGTVGFASGYALTNDVGAAAGAGLGTVAAFRGFEMIGENIISGRQAASEYKTLGLLEQNFVRTKDYPTAKEAAQFYVRATPKEFSEAVALGTKAAASTSKNIPKFKATEPKAGWDMGRIEPTYAKIQGFSPQEFKTEVFKARGIEPPTRMEVRPIGKDTFEIARNPEYSKALRMDELRGGIVDAKPSPYAYAVGKIGATHSKLSEGIQDISGFYVQKGVDIGAVGFTKAASPLMRNERFINAKEAFYGVEASALKGFHETKFRANVAYDKFRYPEINDIYAQKTAIKQSTIIKQQPLISNRPTTLSIAPQIKIISPKQSQAVRFNLATGTKQIGRQATAQNIKLDLRQPLAQSIRQGVAQTTRIGERQTQRQELKTDYIQNLKMDLRQSLNQDLRQNVRQDLRQGLRQDLRQITPVVPKIVPLLKFEMGAGSKRVSKSRNLKKQEFKYSPSIISSEGFVRITGKLSKAITSGKQSLSGLEIRPISSNRASSRAFKGLSSSKSVRMPRMGKIGKIKGLGSSGFKMPKMKGIIGKRRRF